MMTDKEIVQTLKSHPRLNIKGVAKMLRIEPIQVSRAQHNYLKAYLSLYRVSKYWDLRNYKQRNAKVN